MLDSVYPISIIETKFQEAKGCYSRQGMIIITNNVNTLMKLEQFWVEGGEVKQGAYNY